MSSDGVHSAVIERRGVAHQARCACGWSGHSWNELRPAEADAWHHTFGDSRVMDARTASEETAPVPLARSSASVEQIVSAARSLARSSAPHRPSAIDELSRAAGDSAAALTEAQEEIAELLRRHARRSSSAADEEWLELHTARRLIETARSHFDA